MDLNILAAQILADNIRKGFWPKFHSCHHPEPHICGQGICDFPGRDPLAVIALIHSECSEAVEEIRDGRMTPSFAWKATKDTTGPSLEFRGDGAWTVGDYPRPVTDDELIGWGYAMKPVGLPSELADVIIRVLDAAAAWEIDIVEAIHVKMAYNATRDRLHGRAM